jgi:hypothetical protein
MLLAATAMPVGFRPLQQIEWRLFSHDTFDIVVNFAGFVPVGMVLAALGPVRAVVAGALLSLLVEAGQLYMLFRDPALADVASNTLGAMLGVAIATRTNLQPQFVASRRIGAAAAALAVLSIAGMWNLKRSDTWFDSGESATRGNATLEAHWVFDDNNDRLALDTSGHGLNGAYHSAPEWVAGPVGPAIMLDSSEDYVDFGHPAALRLTSSLTISAWIKATGFPRDDAAIVSSYDGFGFQLDTTIDEGPRTIGFKLGSACGTLMARYGATPLALNAWYYVAGVYDAEARTMDVYLNG